MNKVTRYVYEFVSYDGVACRTYKCFSVFHAHAVGEVHWEDGLPLDKAQSLMDEWNAYERRVKGTGRFYLDLPDSTMLWPDVA